MPVVTTGGVVCGLAVKTIIPCQQKDIRLCLLVAVVPNVDVGLVPKRPPPELKALVVVEGCPNILGPVVPVWLVLGWLKVFPPKVPPPPPNAPKPVAGFGAPKAPKPEVF